MPLDAAWSNGETFDGAFFSSLVAQVNTNETAVATKQAADGDLTAIAALTPANDDVLQRKAGVWTNRPMAQLKTDLGLTVAITGTPTVGQIPVATSGTAATWQTVAGGGGGGLSATDNNNGTVTLTGGGVVDNNNGTLTI